MVIQMTFQSKRSHSSTQHEVTSQLIDNEKHLSHNPCLEKPTASVIQKTTVHLLIFSYLRSVDFDRDIVALRCPLGGFSHFEASAGQINTELALKEHIRLELWLSSYLTRKVALSHICRKGSVAITACPHHTTVW